jgi:hypothetical protein
MRIAEGLRNQPITRERLSLVICFTYFKRHSFPLQHSMSCVCHSGISCPKYSCFKIKYLTYNILNYFACSGSIQSLFYIEVFSIYPVFLYSELISCYILICYQNSDFVESSGKIIDEQLL